MFKKLKNVFVLWWYFVLVLFQHDFRFNLRIEIVKHELIIIRFNYIVFFFLKTWSTQNYTNRYNIIIRARLGFRNSFYLNARNNILKCNILFFIFSTAVVGIDWNVKYDIYFCVPRVCFGLVVGRYNNRLKKYNLTDFNLWIMLLVRF